MSKRQANAIKSRNELAEICRLMEWANASDSDEVQRRQFNRRPAEYASQHGLYGHLYNAANTIVKAETGLDLADVNPIWGADGSFLADIVFAIEAMPDLTVTVGGLEYELWTDDDHKVTHTACPGRWTKTDASTGDPWLDKQLQERVNDRHLHFTS